MYVGDETANDDMEAYVVHGAAGDEILSIDDVMEDGELFGMSCGVKYPARIREFSDRKWRKPGGISTAKACVATSGFKGKGDAEGALSPMDSCFMELDVEVHNCHDFTLWMLPKVTPDMMRKSDGKLYVKLAYINLESMDDDNVIPSCSDAVRTMMERGVETHDNPERMYNCIHEDGAISSSEDNDREWPRYKVGPRQHG